jgi:hypothetical protein
MRNGVKEPSIKLGHHIQLQNISSLSAKMRYRGYIIEELIEI